MTLNEIINLSPEERDSYVTNLLSQGWDAPSLNRIVNSLSDSNNINSFVAEYTLAAYIEGDISNLRFIGGGKQFCSEECQALIWDEIPDNTCVIVSKQDASFVISNMAAHSIIGVGDFHTKEFLENERQQEFNYNRDYLTSLGLIKEYDTRERVLPGIPESVLVREDTERFSSAIWFNKIQEHKIILAGLGGIGSYVAFLLSRMRPAELILYDDDIVEEVNMSGQLFSQRDINKSKVSAITRTMQDFSNYYSAAAFKERYTEDSLTSDIMICGFDNMVARKTFFKKWMQHVVKKSDEEKKNCLFIDGRLAAEEFQVLCIRGDDSYNMKVYLEKYLFSDSEAEATVCSYKQTTYMANMIASVMVNLFTNFAANQVIDNLRSLPFFTTYNADSMLFKTSY